VGRRAYCLVAELSVHGAHFEWRRPIDDANTLSVGWFFDRVPNEMEPFTQDRIPPGTRRSRSGDRPFITTHVMNQDFIAWVGQGTVADRTEEASRREHRGIIMMRRKILEQIEVVGAGGEPKAVVRDAKANRSISLPIIGRAATSRARPRGPAPSRSEQHAWPDPPRASCSWPPAGGRSGSLSTRDGPRRHMA